MLVRPATHPDLLDGRWLLATDTPTESEVWIRCTHATRERWIVTITTTDLDVIVHKLRLWADRLDYTLVFGCDLRVNGYRLDTDDQASAFYGFDPTTVIAGCDPAVTHGTTMYTRGPRSG